MDVPTLMVQDSKAGTPTPVFHPMFLTKAGTSETKWDIYAFFKKTEQPNAETGEKSIVILYRIFVVDKGNKNFAYRYDGKVWVPRFEERATMNGIKGRKITVLTNSGSGSLPMTPSTFSSIQGTKAYDFSTSVTSDLTLYALWKATEVKVPTSGTYLMGDVDFDGRIDSGDALFVLRASVGLETVNDTLFKFADVDGDNKITAADSLDILRYSVNLSVNSNVGVKTEI